ncbi:MAG: hypothetical protein LQ347_006677 [Umbilicaria vellea]|nr:MAG: hypothetical protein LQ347_006677 [Umbilicaria vellea]
MDLDLVIRNGTVVTASDIWPRCDIGVKDGTIVAVGANLPVRNCTTELQAEGAFVTPGGVDSHVHLSQWADTYSSGGDDPAKTIVTDGTIPNLQNFAGDTYDTGTRSAVAGGTTTIITFACQLRNDDSLIPVIEEYHKITKGKSYCDYSFHVILSNPTPTILERDLETMVEEYGISSIKIYMTYKALMLRDYEILDVMYVARKLGITTMVHAENADVIEWMTTHLEAKGMTAPHHHGTSRPPIVEAEATVGSCTMKRPPSEPANKHIRIALSVLQN